MGELTRECNALLAQAESENELQMELSGFFEQLLAGNRKVGELETELRQLSVPGKGSESQV
jgi:hypothetical protein